jgi:hypothetical protein
VTTSRAVSFCPCAATVQHKRADVKNMTIGALSWLVADIGPRVELLY